MLAEKSFIKIPKAAIPTIAGQHSGKRVLCQDNEVLTAYNQLAQLARSGNHWARISISGIQGLSAGRLHQNNVFVRKDAPLANGRGRFFMILPGIRATFEDLENGTLMLVGLQVDGNYQALQQRGKKAGLFSVAVDGRKLTITPVTSVKPLNTRCVAISDSTHTELEKVAKSVRDTLLATPQTASTVISNGFDLHYTPGAEPIVGLKAIRNMLKNHNKNNIAESATLLADAIYAAREINGVTWQTSFGGSAILTQALQILHNENKSDFKNHFIHLYHPTSNSQLVSNLAARLNFVSVQKELGYTNAKEYVGNHLPTLFSTKNLLAVGDNGLSAVSTGTTLAGALLGVAFSPAIGVAVASLSLGKTLIGLKKNHVSLNYDRK